MGRNRDQTTLIKSTSKYPTKTRRSQLMAPSQSTVPPTGTAPAASASVPAAVPEANPLPQFLRERYEWLETLGNGAYGTVFKARQLATGETIAIKHLSNIFVDRIRARRALREIVLLTHLHGNDNVRRTLLTLFFGLIIC